MLNRLGKPMNNPKRRIKRRVVVVRFCVSPVSPLTALVVTRRDDNSLYATNTENPQSLAVSKWWARTGSNRGPAD